MKKMFFLSTLVMLVFASQSFALYNLMDHYAAEVLLNKEGIEHNLDFMKSAANVDVQENRVTYRSSYDGDIAVILENVNHDDGLAGLSVRLQLPLKEEITLHVWSVVKFKDAMLGDVDMDFLKSLGYTVDIFGAGVIDDRPDEEPTLERPVTILPVDEEFGHLVEPPPAPGMPEPVDGDEVVIAPRDDSGGVPSIEPDSMWIRSILLSKGDVNWTIAQYTSADGDSVEFLLNIANADTISDEVKKDLQKMIEFFGLDESALSQLDENMNVMQAMTLVPAKSEYDFSSAMKAELTWLQENGIVVGITERDIADIASLTKPGSAGWNSRIVYSEGRWFPYYETDDAKLIRTIMEGAEADAPTVGVPEDMVSFPTTSVSPNSKSITQWGRIKSVF